MLAASGAIRYPIDVAGISIEKRWRSILGAALHEMANRTSRY
jgi:hypothetical protein